MNEEAGDQDFTEEELLVYVDFGKFVPASDLTDPDLQFKIIGLEGDPVLAEVNGRVYQGN